jgi:arylsulfatase A-like enzyme
MFFAAALATAQAQAQPNILILFTDDQRRTTVGAYGVEDVHTPTMNRIVEEGTSFDNCYIMGSMGGAVCVPSRAMLMTGRGLFHLSKDDNGNPAYDGRRIPAEHITFGETFRSAGYETFSTGKWHQDKASFNRSFSHGGNIYFGGMHQYNTGGHKTPWLWDYDPSGAYPSTLRTKRGTFSSELFADATIDFLRTRDDNKPFLAYVPFSSPHDPRHAPDWFADMYPVDEIELPPNYMPEHPFDNGTLRIRDEQLAPNPRSPMDTKKEIAAYYAMVTEVDYHMGRIMDELDRQGLDENTIVVFTSDHGLGAGQHGLMGKQNVYEHSMKAPFAIKGPGIPAGESRDTFIHLNDLGPTLHELAGVTIPESNQMTSFSHSILDKTTVHRESVVFSYSWHQRAIRKGPWKLAEYMVKGVSTTQLFHVEADPFELHNLAAHPLHTARVAELRKELAQMVRDREDVVDIDLPNWGREDAKSAS